MGCNTTRLISPLLTSVLSASGHSVIWPFVLQRLGRCTGTHTTRVNYSGATGVQTTRTDEMILTDWIEKYILGGIGITI